jgi:hypothetical protein
MGGNRHHTKKPTLAIDSKLRQAILDTERLLRKDELTSPAKPPADVQLDYEDRTSFHAGRDLLSAVEIHFHRS